MKGHAQVCAHRSGILLCALLFALVIAAQGELPAFQAHWGLSGGLLQATGPVTPTVTDDIWGPEVIPPSTGESTTPVLLSTSDDQVAANSTIVSDDFNACTLDESLWTFIDPVGDCTQDMVGTFTDDAWLYISAPAGSSHDLYEYGNFAPRVMQAASDTDFEVEARFESGLSQRHQMQGILVEQASDHFLRFEFYSDGSNTKLYVASFEPNPLPPPPLSHTVYYHASIADTDVAPLYMRVKRQANQWTPYYSYDGDDWSSPVSFPYALTVTKVGVYAANHATPPEASPAHTGYIDYFFNTASPTDPEDAERNTLTVEVLGSGSVNVDPVKSSYDCGDAVTLEAMADPGWSFAGWRGDLTGTENPATISMDGSKIVTAAFKIYGVYLPLVAKAPFANYVFVGDFETGDLTGFYWLANKPEVVTSPHPVRGGNYSLKSYLHRRESPTSYRTEVVTCRDDDMPAGTRKPIELNNTGGYDSEYWIGFSVYVPGDYVIDVEGRYDMVFQIHGVPDEDGEGDLLEAYRNPLLALVIDVDDWHVVSRWDSRRITPGPPFAYPGVHDYETPLNDSIGRWTDWVIHIRLSYEPSGDGLLEIWKDGMPWIVQDGPNCYNDERGPLPAMGIYKWAWREDVGYETNTDYRLFYHDELRIAGADGSYGVVAP
jgi:hypothetical protein